MITQNIKNIKNITNYIRAYWQRSVLAVITASLFGAVSAFPAALLKYSIDDLFIKQHHYLIIPFLLFFVGIFILKSIFMYLTSYNLYWVSHRAMNDLKKDLFKKLIYFPIAFFKKQPAGTLISRFLHDITMIQVGITSLIKDGVRSLFEALFLITFAFWQQPHLAFMLLLLAPILGFIVIRLGQARKKASIAIQEKTAAIAHLLQESFMGIKDIKTFNGEPREINRLLHFLENNFCSLMHNAHLESICPALVEGVAMSAAAITMYWAIQQVLAGLITPGQLVSFIGALILAYQPIKKISAVYSDILYSVGAAERIFSLMATPCTESSPKITLKNFCYSIEAKNLSFSYEQQPVLHQVSFSIKKGSRVGIIGASGSGKSTLADLILGFLKPTAGSLVIDHVQPHALSPESIHQIFGCVSQTPFLFNDTILNNLTYGQINKTEEEVHAACKKAAIHDFIMQLPHTYHHFVGENGSLLSGGQKQRLAIARALLKNPEILVFDEATSALDQETEALIKQALLSLSPETTVLLITHRPSLLTLTDTQLFLENGTLHHTKNIEGLSTSLLQLV